MAPGSKLAIFAALVTRPEGATRKELIAATGWPGQTTAWNSLKGRVEVYRKEKTPEGTRYFGRHVEDAAEVV